MHCVRVAESYIIHVAPTKLQVTIHAQKGETNKRQTQKNIQGEDKQLKEGGSANKIQLARNQTNYGNF
ncbi:hypothetical protein T4C_492 [Trichinella pseudospiralis]|uniref:Uncharacterized protein n=1 Tax=Trichinella pseudospiralis TaxID=6337 RepID=A0A0V1GQB5_TRIPS|nr:hypothetical protein T4C_492 [Trichinella pseudospiralis]